MSFQFSEESGSADVTSALSETDADESQFSV